jgi:hypothetical protein
MAYLGGGHSRKDRNVLLKELERDQDMGKRKDMKACLKCPVWQAHESRA